MLMPPLTRSSIPAASGRGERRPDPGSAAGGPRSPERRLLLAAVCRAGDPAEIEALLGPDLDWERLLAGAAHHGVAPLVYSTLKTGFDGAAVPAAAMERLAHEYYQQAAMNGQLYAGLQEILTACARAGIHVLVLKGAAIAERVYGNIALCPMRDLDLLVMKEDLEATDRLLGQLGYVHDESHHSAKWYQEHYHHLSPYRRPGGRSVYVEVHHHIVPPPASARIPIEDLWRRARPFGAGALVLSPDDLLLHLCLHVSVHHQFCAGLRSVCDISESIRYYCDEIDWTQVRHRAVQWRVGKYVYLALRLARDLVGAAVPEAVLDSLRPADLDPRVVAWTGAQIIPDELIPSPSEHLAQLCGPKRLREKAALLLKTACPPPRVMARLYPASHGSKRIYLYYPVRWKDLFLKYGRSAWRLLRRDDAMMLLAEREDQKTALRKWLAWDFHPERSPGA
jgi:hypothetical protein